MEGTGRTAVTCMMRLIVRAWREVTDGIWAGAAKWEQRWAASEAGNPLARRLQFNDTVSYFGTEAGWRVCAIYFHMDPCASCGRKKIGKPGDAATRGARTSNTGFTSSMSVASQHLSQRRSADPTHGVSRPNCSRSNCLITLFILFCCVPGI